MLLIDEFVRTELNCCNALLLYTVHCVCSINKRCVVCAFFALCTMLACCYCRITVSVIGHWKSEDCS